jgi:tryptophan-rich sensory protein
MKRLPYVLIPLGVLALGVLSGSFTDSRDWYATLEKPFFTPPSWAFGPVWTVLYLLIGWAGARKLELGGARSLWALQMVLNLTWTPVFFGLRAPVPALGIIAAMLITIVAFIVREWRTDRTSALLFVPYAAWVSVATALNLAIVVLNRPGA